MYTQLKAFSVGHANSPTAGNCQQTQEAASHRDIDRHCSLYSQSPISMHISNTVTVHAVNSTWVIRLGEWQRSRMFAQWSRTRPYENHSSSLNEGPLHMQRR